VTENSFTPTHFAFDGCGMRVEQKFGRITAQPLLGFPRTVNPQAVASTRVDARKVAMPNMPGVSGKFDSLF
jgi:hypothetical protein